MAPVIPLMFSADFGVSAKNTNSRQKRDSFIGTPYWSVQFIGTPYWSVQFHSMFFANRHLVCLAIRFILALVLSLQWRRQIGLMPVAQVLDFETTSYGTVKR